MSALSRLRAWLRSSTTPGVPADWQQQLAEVAEHGRFDTVVRLIDGWRDPRPGNDRQFAQWLAQSVGGCSCSASHVVVIHDRGTMCGDEQSMRLAHKIAEADGRYVGLPPLADLTYEGMAATVLDELRGPDPEPDIEITDLDAW